MLIENLDKDLGKIERVNDQFVEETKRKQLRTSEQIKTALDLTKKLQGLESTFKQLKSQQNDLNLSALKHENTSLLDANIKLKKA